MPREPVIAAVEWNEIVPQVAPAAASRSKIFSFLRAAFSFPVALSFALTVLTVLTVAKRFDDPDLWWHLKVGELIWTTHSIPSSDLFSFTTANHPWVAHEWLAEVAIYATYRAGGYTGLMIWLCAVPSLLFVLVYAVSSLYSGNAKISLLGGMVAWFFGTVGLAVRPHTLGYLFLVVELLVVHLARTRNRRWFWALPALFAVWVNCHGSWALGLMVLGIFLACSFLELQAGSLVCSRWPAEQRRLLAVSAALSVAALIVNPIGWRLPFYPLNVFVKQTQSLASVTEWLPLDLLDPRAAVLFGVAAWLFLMVLMRGAKLRLEELIILTLGFGLAIRHQRMLFVFGILAAPIICRLLTNAWDKYDPARDLLLANAVMIAAAVCTIVAAFPNPRQIQAQVIKDSPVQAVDYIRRTGLKGRMLNGYDFGGYLIWAFPEQKVFIDGRGDIFDWTGVLAEYGRWATLSEDPKLMLEKYGIDYCLFRKDAPPMRLLGYLPGWKKVYEDQLAVIFVRGAA